MAYPMNRTFLPRVLTLLLLSLSVLNATDTDSATTTWKAGLLTWRADLAKDLQQPNGWLTLIGLEWLKPGDNTFGSAPGNNLVVRAPPAAYLGVVQLNDKNLQLLPPHGGYPKGVMVDGKVPEGHQTLGSDDSEHPSKITTGTVTITVI